MTAKHDNNQSPEHGGQSCSSVVISITNKLNAASCSAPEHTIFRVHQLLRSENEMAYEPEILAIGPYHRGKPRVQVMEDQKLRWLKKCLEEDLGEEGGIMKYVEPMKRLECKARGCYSESTSEVNADDFVEMMLLDGCFIIQFMRKWINNDLSEPFLENCVIGSLIRDMMIFENQIPLFVLEKLFSLIRLPKEPGHFHEFALKFFKDRVFRMMFPDTIPNDADGMKTSSDSSNGVPHILGFLHDLLRSLDARNNNKKDDPSINDKTSNNNTSPADDPSIDKTNNNNSNPVDDPKTSKAENVEDENTESIQSATKLQAAGVQFKSKNRKSKNKNRESQLLGEAQLGSAFESSFKNGVMEIPTFTIDDYTESLYRNLIAYEQYNKESDYRFVVLYAELMDCLIDSPEDVALLRECRIIHNDLGDDRAVSTMFNKLLNHVILPESDVQSELFKEVNAYSGKRRHKWMAKLRSDYFNSPWALVSFLAAVFLIVLTVIQTVCSILGVLKTVA